MDLTINSHFIIPSKELQWRFSRSSGPGGQGVNTTDSRVELIFDIKNSSVIRPYLKQRLIKQLESRCIKGCLRIIISEERSQYRNRQLALAHMTALLNEGLKPSSQTRRPTKPTLASTKRRIKSKKHRGALKQQRQSKPSITE